MHETLKMLIDIAAVMLVKNRRKKCGWKTWMFLCVWSRFKVEKLPFSEEETVPSCDGEMTETFCANDFV